VDFALGSRSARAVGNVYMLGLPPIEGTSITSFKRRVRVHPLASNVFSNLHNMAIRFFRHTTLITAFAALTAFVAAQEETIIPEDFRSGFRPGGDEVQVSFTGEAINGFKDGTVFEKDG
jgi:hypothetical protein